MNEQCVGPALHGLAERVFQLRVGTGIHDHDLNAEGLSGRLERLAVGRIGILGLTSTAMAAVLGLSSFRSCRRFGTSCAFMKDIPVMLPPGRFRLATSPYCTGSLPFAKTMGMVVVAAFAARAETTLPVVKMTSTRRATRSAASAGSLS